MRHIGKSLKMNHCHRQIQKYSVEILPHHSVLSAAITIFTKRLVRDRAIPFTVSAEGDHFYSENNLRHLQVAAEEMDRGYYVKHDIIEDEKP